jgi:hypothetical protein
VMDMDCVFCELRFELSCIIKSNVRTVLFWAITQLVLVISYGRFGTTHSSPSSVVKNLRRPLFFFSLESSPLTTGLIGCLETSVRNYHYTLCNSPEEHSSYLLRGGSLNSLKSSVSLKRCNPRVFKLNGRRRPVFVLGYCLYHRMLYSLQ